MVAESNGQTVRGSGAAQASPDGPLPGSMDRRSPVAPQVYGILRESIVSARLAPGQALSENDVSTRLGVSRTPVREAFIRLAMDGLVRVYPQLGTIVSRIDVEAVVEAQFVREVLEVASARLACSIADPAFLVALYANLDAQAEACSRNDVDAFHELDEALHRSIFDAAGHPAAWRIVHAAKPHLDRVRLLTLPDATTRLGDLAEHRDIVDALAAGSTEAADEAVRRHARAILSALPKLQERHPEYFTESP